jgi:CcmD family protein
MQYLFAAFCVTWLVLFLYLFSISRRQRALSQEIESLRRTLQERPFQTGGKSEPEDEARGSKR